MSKDKAIVERLFWGGVQVAEALKEIRDKHLFEGVAESFDEYCHVRWKMKPGQAEELIGLFMEEKQCRAN